MAKFARRIETMAESAGQLHALTSSLAGGSLVSFGAGAPAVEAYPFDKIRDICGEVFSGPEKALDAYFPACTRHTVPDGGYYVWAEVPGFDMTGMAKEIADQLGICYGIGSTFYTEGNPEGSGRSTMRLNFSGLTEDVIEENLKKLGGFLKEKLA